MKRKFSWLPLVGIVAVAVGAYVVLRSSPDRGPVMCTLEAKQCPDGSYVGRTGPKCEFTPCPTSAPKMRTVMLSYYDPARDRDANGNVLCSAKGLVSVHRDIPFTNTPIQDTVRFLLSSKPTAQEKADGLVSEFPLAGVELTAASLTNGTLTLTFADPDHRTSGGSCFVSILSAQVQATAKQFSGVSQVRLAPADLFQP